MSFFKNGEQEGKMGPLWGFGSKWEWGGYKGEEGE
jgi:hypothetical protein